MVLHESPIEQLRRLAHQVERLRLDAAAWHRAGRLDTASELDCLIKVLADTVARLERDLFPRGHPRVPTIFDP